ncbi:PucR family transcriptional regulator [Streptomyces thermolineatus]|uniref:PucR family transcriptional regulator n=1 Tax=Streptomyces thermolineatus TaxID=44033 RepID=A0ABN3KXI5_9ACTN|nr:helix-turn-helix domain-containing protein [Streptomyces sp. HB2AG]MCZ2527019.1 helix-turn-helix domain-containing protein [Streptomyces sp. HB2AG]
MSGVSEHGRRLLPHEIVERMRSELGDLAQETIREIRRQVPEFAQPLEGPFARTIRVGVERSLAGFVTRVSDPPPAGEREEIAELSRSLGRIEMREGRSLDALQAAYRIGARLAWRRWVKVGQEAEIAPARMYGLAEAVFAYIDELASHAVEGYAQAQADTAGELHRRRQRLLEALLSERPPEPEELSEAARAARWPLPRTVAALVLRREQPPGERPHFPRLPGTVVLADFDRADPVVLLPDPAPEHVDLLERDLRGARAALGPRVEPADAAASLHTARRLMELIGRGLEEHRRVARCTDHLASLVLLEDERLLDLLAGRRLAPLEQVRPKQRERLAETLLAWLQCGGSAPEVARAINVHPQTVRYRLRQIEELFGADLRDPDARFELGLVLRARTLLPSSRWPSPL